MKAQAVFFVFTFILAISQVMSKSNKDSEEPEHSYWIGQGLAWMGQGIGSSKSGSFAGGGGGSSSDGSSSSFVVTNQNGIIKTLTATTRPGSPDVKYTVTKVKA